MRARKKLMPKKKIHSRLEQDPLRRHPGIDHVIQSWTVYLKKR